MNEWVRHRVPELTVALSALSLSLVFGAVLQVGPLGALPHAPDAVIGAIPHVNAALSVAAIVTIVAGVRAIRRGQVTRHRRLMLATFALFVVFLAAYLYRVSVEGPTEFAGPAWVATYVYFPILGVHILFAIVCIPLVYYVLLLAYGHPVGRLAETNHPRVGRIAAALWLLSFALGTVVYAMLYWLF